MPEQKELEFSVDKDYLALPTSKLLEEYGKGNHIPGSGSAAALSALFAIEMMKTVCKLTLRKPQYRNEHIQIQFILEELDGKFKPQLLRLFDEDIKIFHRVSMYRRQRDEAKDEKQKKEFNKKALDEQRIATEIPIQICRICLEILELAFAIFDKGFKSARGDSGVAISNLLSAISGALFVIFLNLKSFPKSLWVNRTRLKAEVLARKYNKFQTKAFEKVLELYEALEDANYQLKFEIFSEE